MNKPRETLDEQLARLDRNVTLPRDLWPAIERRIDSRPQDQRRVALAASVVVAVAAAAILGALWHGRTGIGPDAHAGGFDEPKDPAYRAARADLEHTFRQRLGLLDPTTRARIEASLGDIRHAHEELRSALAAQPSNPILQDLLESTWHDEFDLYDSVVQGTQPAMARS